MFSAATHSRSAGRFFEEGISSCFALKTTRTTKTTIGHGEVRVYRGTRYPVECGQQLGRDPSQIGSSKSLVLKSFYGHGTHWDSPLLVSLTLRYTPVRFTPLLALPQRENDEIKFRKQPLSKDYRNHEILKTTTDQNHPVLAQVLVEKALLVLYRRGLQN